MAVPLLRVIAPDAPRTPEIQALVDQRIELGYDYWYMRGARLREKLTDPNVQLEDDVRKKMEAQCNNASQRAEAMLPELEARGLPVEISTAHSLEHGQMKYTFSPHMCDRKPASVVDDD